MDGMEPERIRALALLSGGLDSRLAVCLLKQQGIDVQGIVFKSPFFEIGEAVKGAEQLDISLHVHDFSKDIIELLDNPKHGFGSCMNPCVDCHARMLKRAGEFAEDTGCRFLVTGEVLNERPKSQNRRSLDIVAEESGYRPIILRPLSAKLLPATEPELKGWVDRECLEGIQGRSRKRQFQLAETFGLREFPSPAGGCRLTEPNFSRRLLDLKEHEGLQGIRSIRLLRVGRHFRLSTALKLIVGRNERDNAVIEGAAELYDLVLKPEDVPGPTGLLPFTASKEEVRLSAAICARYSDAPRDGDVRIRVRSPRNVDRLDVVPVKPEEIEVLRI